MLVSQRPRSGSGERHGCHRAVLSHLQGGGATKKCEDRFRQRLLALAERLARVRALGNEYARVEFSEHVQGLMDEAGSAA